MASWVARYPWIPFVVPFAFFMLWMMVEPHSPLGLRGTGLFRVVTLIAVIVWLAVPVFERHFRAPWQSIVLGIVVFLLWIAPEELISGWRSHPVFVNDMLGSASGSFPEAARTDPLLIALRTFRAVLIVPIVEELFWRGWLPRWVDHPHDFQAAPLGQFTQTAFWITAILFAVEHGSRWDVGLVAGILYNWWMTKTKSLADLTLCHAVTNGCLAAWSVAGQRWQYW